MTIDLVRTEPKAGMTIRINQFVVRDRAGNPIAAGVELDGQYTVAHVMDDVFPRVLAMLGIEAPAVTQVG